MSFESEMKQYDDQWKETETDTGGATLFTDGTHQAEVTVCRVTEHVDFGWQWEIGVAGTDNNTGQRAVLTKWHGLPPSEQGFKYVKQDAEILGYSGPLSKLDKACASGQFEGVKVEIYVKSKPGKNDPSRTFSNLYLNRQITGDEFPAAASDEDIPF